MQKLGPWQLELLSGRSWTWIEHTSFWSGLLLAIASFRLGRDLTVPKKEPLIVKVEGAIDLRREQPDNSIERTSSGKPEDAAHVERWTAPEHGSNGEGMSELGPTSPVSLRVATVADVPALFSVRTSVRENHLDLAQLAERSVTPGSIADMLADGAARSWVVEEGHEVVAYSMADARSGTVFDLFVRPESEGRGYGRALLWAAEEWLFAAGWATIWLHTGQEPYLRAHRLYRAAGWELVGPADHEDVRYEKHRAV